MIKNLLSLCLILVLFSGCQYENALELYNNGGEIKPVSTNGLLAHIPFEKEITDISTNKTALSFQGKPLFIKGVNGKDSSALYLSGFPQCLTLNNIGMHDTLSIFLWFKTDNQLTATDSLSLFDYGVQSFGVKLDGTTGATRFVSTQNGNTELIPDWINSFNVWNYLYAEAGGGKLKIIYKGAMLNKEPINVDLDKDAPGILNPITDVFYIGRPANGTNSSRHYFKGSIDNVRIYNRQLSKTEVLSLISEDTGN